MSAYDSVATNANPNDTQVPTRRDDLPAPAGYLNEPFQPVDTTQHQTRSGGADYPYTIGCDRPQPASEAPRWNAPASATSNTEERTGALDYKSGANTYGAAGTGNASSGNGPAEHLRGGSQGYGDSNLSSATRSDTEPVHRLHSQNDPLPRPSGQDSGLGYGATSLDEPPVHRLHSQSDALPRPSGGFDDPNVYDQDRQRDASYGTDSKRDTPSFGTDSKRDDTYGSDNKRDTSFGADTSYGTDNKRDTSFGSEIKRDTYGTDSNRDTSYGSDNKRDTSFGTERQSDSTYGTDSKRDTSYGTDNKHNISSGDRDTSYGTDNKRDNTYGDNKREGFSTDARDTQPTDYAARDNQPAGHASMTDKLVGKTQQVVGKMTNNTGMQEKGELRQTAGKEAVLENYAAQD